MRSSKLFPKQNDVVVRSTIPPPLTNIKAQWIEGFGHGLFEGGVVAHSLRVIDGQVTYASLNTSFIAVDRVVGNRDFISFVISNRMRRNINRTFLIAPNDATTIIDRVDIATENMFLQLC